MFEKFGEMSSCREINELAENLLNEGDFQSLKVMAEEKEKQSGGPAGCRHTSITTIAYSTI